MRLLLIDGHYYAYRSFFAIRELSNSRGEPTNAIYGFVKTLRRMVRDLAPDLGAVIWDMGIPKRRAELQPQYKAQREEMPDLLRSQISIIQRIVPLLGFSSLGQPDTEADDLIATYATCAKAQGLQSIIATNDKDLYQLVDDHCLIYSTNKSDIVKPDDSYALLGEAKVQEKWGVSANQIGEVLALIGDNVDNIPGVDGVGPKTAANLLNQFGSLDALLANLPQVKNERMREKLAASLEQIAQNREMVRLDLDLELPIPIDELQITPNYPALMSELEACEFKTLLAEVRADMLKAPKQPSVPMQGELFA